MTESEVGTDESEQGKKESGDGRDKVQRRSWGTCIGLERK